MKYGESYESLAKNIEPYLRKRNTAACSLSIYPEWWDKTITVYNKYEDSVAGIVSWYKTVLDNCFVKMISGFKVSDKGVISADNIIVRVPENSCFQLYKDWIANSEPKSYFTFNQGDIVILDEACEAIDEAVPGKRSNDIKSKYQELGICFMVNVFKDNTGAGRGTPHYYISGE